MAKNHLWTTETKKTTKRKKSTPVSVETAEVEQKQIEQEQAKDEVVAEEAHAEAVDDNMSSEDQPDVAENERRRAHAWRRRKDLHGQGYGSCNQARG